MIQNEIVIGGISVGEGEKGTLLKAAEGRSKEQVVSREETGPHIRIQQRGTQILDPFLSSCVTFNK